MTGNNAQGRRLRRGLAAIEVKISRALRDVLAAEQLGGSFSNELVAGAMKTPATDTGFVPAFRNGVTLGGGRGPLIKGGLKQAD